MYKFYLVILAVIFLLCSGCKKTIHNPCGVLDEYMLIFGSSEVWKNYQFIGSTVSGGKRSFIIADFDTNVCPNSLMEFEFTTTLNKNIQSRNFEIKALAVWDSGLVKEYVVSPAVHGSDLTCTASGNLDIKPRYNNSPGFASPRFIYQFDSYGNYSQDSAFFYGNFQSVSIKSTYNEVK